MVDRDAAAGLEDTEEHSQVYWEVGGSFHEQTEAGQIDLVPLNVDVEAEAELAGLFAPSVQVDEILFGDALQNGGKQSKP